MENQNCLDSILEEVGEFGKYQRRICFFIFCVIIISHFGGEIYVFEAKQINHRCHVPGCDVNETEFKPSWWVYAIPSEEDQPSKCFKFSRFNSSSGTCGESDFNKEVKERCKEFVYETSEISILHDFNLQCDENVWKLTLPGTLFGAGLFIGLPISGILSDRFGRKTMLISTAVVSGVIAIVRSFSNSYAMYLSLEVLDSTTRAGLYAFCYVLGVELVGPKRRALVSLLNSSAYATGGMFVGGIAWLLQSWKTLVRVLYSFHFLAILCYWLVPESVRWLLANNQSDKAQNILLTLAKVNGKSISKENLNKLESYNSNKETIKSNSIKELFTSVTLTLRLINCSICWTCCIFLYNGLTVNSVDLSGNSYLDYILTIFVEIPGFATAYVIVDRIGRKISLIIGFLIASFACIASIFIPNGKYILFC
ncbi:hypothetical protein FQR65_LT08212 [Abscondita terminalis]|nr:hypothetical protein FQR65_LT08212 [Abscondita terminalis]